MFHSIVDNMTTYAGQAWWLATYFGYWMYSKRINTNKMLESFFECCRVGKEYGHSPLWKVMISHGSHWSDKCTEPVHFPWASHSGVAQPDLSVYFKCSKYRHNTEKLIRGTYCIGYQMVSILQWKMGLQGQTTSLTSPTTIRGGNGGLPRTNPGLINQRFIEPCAELSERTVMGVRPLLWGCSHLSWASPDASSGSGVQEQARRADTAEVFISSNWKCLCSLYG